MEMKKIKYTGIGVLLLALLMIFPMVSAVAGSTLITPINDGNYTGTIFVNVTTDVANAMNITCLYNTSDGLALAAFTVVENTSVGQTVFEGDVDVSAFTDGITYNISCSVFGDTTEEAVPASGITIDNTDPVVTLEVLLDDMTVSSGSVFDYKCTIADAIDSGTTNVFTVINPLSVATSLSIGSSDFLNFVDTDEAGSYVFSCEATDYTGNSATSTATVVIDELGRSTITQTADSDSNNGLWIILIALAVLAYLYYNRK